jgi:hypothetical protein
MVCESACLRFEKCALSPAFATRVDTLTPGIFCNYSFQGTLSPMICKCGFQRSCRRIFCVTADCKGLAGDFFILSATARFTTETQRPLRRRTSRKPIRDTQNVSRKPDSGFRSPVDSTGVRKPDRDAYATTPCSGCVRTIHRLDSSAPSAALRVGTASAPQPLPECKERIPQTHLGRTKRELGCRERSPFGVPMRPIGTNTGPGRKGRAPQPPPGSTKRIPQNRPGRKGRALHLQFRLAQSGVGDCAFCEFSWRFAHFFTELFENRVLETHGPMKHRPLG